MTFGVKELSGAEAREISSRALPEADDGDFRIDGDVVRHLVRIVRVQIITGIGIVRLGEVVIELIGNVRTLDDIDVLRRDCAGGRRQIDRAVRRNVGAGKSSMVDRRVEFRGRRPHWCWCSP